MRVLSPGRTPPAAVSGKLISDDFFHAKDTCTSSFQRGLDLFNTPCFTLSGVSLIKIAVSINTVVIL